MTPQMVQTAPMAVGENDKPSPILLCCSLHGDRPTGVWLRAGYSDGVWLRQGWRVAANHTVELRPTK